jgi:hypothetical protein
MYSGSLARHSTDGFRATTKRFDSTCGRDELLVSERGTVPSGRQE